MDFAFLNPWFWAAALGLAVPVWLHLRRKKERNVVRFSAVRFLDDAPRARRSPLCLEQLWLLLLRSLAVLLIVAAFAWPYWRRHPAALSRESVVYILDNTLSHQANDGFNLDRQRLLDQLKRTGPDVRVAVVELTSVPRVISDFKDSRLAARQKVEQLRASFERGPYLAAFRQAGALLDRSASPHKRIVLLADNQANQWDGSGTPPFLSGIELELPRAGVAQKPNLWLSDLRAHRRFLGNKSTVTFTMRLGHLGPAHRARVSLQANGQTVFNRAVDLEGQPQTILLQGQCDADPQAWIRAEASVEGIPDALAGDNRAFVSVPPVVEGEVALLAQSPYLRLALSPEVMRGQWTTRTLDPSALAAELASSHYAEVLCLESAYLQNPDARSLLKRYLADGRGVFLIVNRLSPTIDGCLRELGFEPEGMAVAEDAAPERFQFVMSNHSLFRSFQSSEFGDLMDIRVLSHARLLTKTARPLIFSQKGDGLFFEAANHRGKLFVCAFGLGRLQSSWPVDPTFIPFVDLTLQAARPQQTPLLAFKPGESTSLQVPPGRSGRTVVLRVGSRQIGTAPVQRGKVQLRMPGEPGLYDLAFDGQTPAEQILSVNPDPKESELEFVDSPKEVRSWQLDPAHRPLGAHPWAEAQVGLSAILQQDLWWWMVLGGLLALILETAWAHAKGESA